MPDLMQYLRMQNLFPTPQMGNDMPTQGGFTGGMQPSLIDRPANNPWNNVSLAPQQSVSFPTPNTAPPAPAQPAASDNMISRMQQMYHPETAATDRFSKMLDTYPKRSENEPSVLRRIGGALMAVSGGLPAGRGMNFYKANPQAIGQGVGFMDKPFEDKLTDWKNQISPIEQGANLERYHNVNERTMAYQAVSNQLKDEAQKHKEANDAVNAQIKQHRADIYEFKAMHPGLKFDFHGPTVMAADPISGKVNDTGIPTGSMSELDKMNLSQDFSMQRIGATGEEARKTETVRQTGRENLEDIKQTGRTDIQNTKLNFKTGAGGKPETPTQTRVRQFNTARELYNTRPDLRPFIKLGNPGANDFTVIPPTEGFFGHRGPSADLYNEAKNKIYGDTAIAPVSAHSPNGPAVQTGGNGTSQNGPDLGKQPPQRGNSNESSNKRDYSKEKTKVPRGRVLVVDKVTGEPIGNIPDTPEQRQLAAKKYQVVD
jgi:hypothetical protein